MNQQNSQSSVKKLGKLLVLLSSCILLSACCGVPLVPFI